MIPCTRSSLTVACMILLCGCYGAKSDMWDPEPVFPPDGAQDTEAEADIPDTGEVDLDLPDAEVFPDIPPDYPPDPRPDEDVNLCELPCDDGIDCTEDRCEPSIGCIFTPIDARCDDGIHCSIDRCDPGFGCEHTPDHSLCSDGVRCTLDRCDLSIGACTNTPRHDMCADTIDCTVDVCDPHAGCLNTPDDSLCAPGETCDPDCNGCILDVAPAGRFLAHSSSSLYQIDPEDPSGTYVGDIGFSVTDIAVTSDNMLWGVTYSSLLSIDFCTGIGIEVGVVGSTSTLNALVAAPGGMLYGADYNGDVWRIDPATGRGSLIGNYGMGLHSSGDLAYGPDGNLYGSITASWAHLDLLIAVDPATGDANIVGNIGFDEVFGLAVLDGVLYGLTDAGQLITISMSTGRGTLVGTVGSSFWGAASPP